MPMKACESAADGYSFRYPLCQQPAWSDAAEATARLITFPPLIANSGLASMNQIHTCVPNNSEPASDVLGIAGPFLVVDRADDVTANPGGSGHITKEVYRLFLDRHELSDRFALLCDGDRPALLRHLVHQA